VLDLDAMPELSDAARQQRFFVAIGAALRVEEGAA
jgi:MSHA biogenesis protein MshI